MDKLLLNRNLVKNNRFIKTAVKNAKKNYGKIRGSVIRSKIMKFVTCQETAFNEPEKKYDTINCSFEEFTGKLEAADHKGKSGSCFPSAQKIIAFHNSSAVTKTIIINAAECEPGLVHDQWLVENQIEKISAGMKSLKNITGADTVYLAAKKFPEKIILNKKGTGTDTENTSIIFQKIPAAYPMGEEHVLISQITGCNILPSEIPLSRGILVMNVQTLIEMYDILSGTLRNGRYVTIADLDNAKAYPVFVNYNENIREKLISFFGNRKAYYAGGGIFRAHEIKDDLFDESICFACVADKTAENSNTNRCKGCGACQRRCPARVQIKRIVRIKESDPDAKISGLGIESCLHCNSCSFNCAAQKNLLEYLM